MKTKPVSSTSRQRNLACLAGALAVCLATLCLVGARTLEPRPQQATLARHRRRDSDTGLRLGSPGPHRHFQGHGRAAGSTQSARRFQGWLAQHLHRPHGYRWPEPEPQGQDRHTPAGAGLSGRYARQRLPGHRRLAAQQRRAGCPVSKADAIALMPPVQPAPACAGSPDTPTP